MEEKEDGWMGEGPAGKRKKRKGEEEGEKEMERTTALKLPIQIRGYIYYGKLAIAENAAQLKRAYCSELL